MGLYSPPPPLVPFPDIKPTLLVCWWITSFCFIIILLRLAGRYIRSERLFVEDRTVALAIIPLFLRMGCVHVILVFGTNNVEFDGGRPTDSNIHRRAVGSGLVLASRIFHAATLWIFKITILEFFRRISDALSERFSQIALVMIRYILAATFIAIVISDLAECQPFGHYWQVFPDPGGQCRQGFAQLMTMSISNVITDLLLVLFPIPIILFSHQSVKRKVQLILLFSLSLGVVGATLYRVSRVIEAHGDQQLRSLLASVELLFATAAANALVLGSFVRDRGIKKKKFRGGSVLDSMERSSIARSRRPTANRHWGSDEDLVRGLGLGVQPNLRDSPDSFIGDDVMSGGPPGGRTVRPAPILRIDDTGNELYKDDIGEGSSHSGGDSGVGDLSAWQFPDGRRSMNAGGPPTAQSGFSDDGTFSSRDPLSPVSRNNSTSAPRKVSFFDAGNLLGNNDDGESETDTLRNGTGTSMRSPGSSAGLQSSGGSVPPSPAYAASSRGTRRGSTALLHDIGGLLGPPSSRRRQSSEPRSAGLQTVPQDSPFLLPSSPLSPRQQSIQSSRFPTTDFDDMSLMDAGGLLSPGPPHR